LQRTALGKAAGGDAALPGTQRLMLGRCGEGVNGGDWTMRRPGGASAKRVRRRWRELRLISQPRFPGRLQRSEAEWKAIRDLEHNPL